MSSPVYLLDTNVVLHLVATWLTTPAWPKALNVTMRRAHPMNIYGLVMIDNLIAPAGAG